MSGVSPVDDLYVSHLCAVSEPSPNLVHLCPSNHVLPLCVFTCVRSSQLLFPLLSVLVGILSV